MSSTLLLVGFSLSGCNCNLLAVSNLVGIRFNSCLGSNIGCSGKGSSFGISGSSSLLGRGSSGSSLIGFLLNTLLIGSGLSSSGSVGGSLGSLQVADSGITGLLRSKLSSSGSSLLRGGDFGSGKGLVSRSLSSSGSGGGLFGLLGISTLCQLGQVQDLSVVELEFGGSGQSL